MEFLKSVLTYVKLIYSFIFDLISNFSNLISMLDFYSALKIADFPQINISKNELLSNKLDDLTEFLNRGYF